MPDPQHARKTSRFIAAMACVAAIWLATGLAPAETVPTSQQDDAARAAKIVGPTHTPNACATCHPLEVAAWQHTAHFATFQVRHQSEAAQEVLKAMGLRSMKRSGVCLDCHYTSELRGDRVAPTWGVSCESCHGGAAEYLEIHNALEGKRGAPQLKWGDGKTESTEQRRARLNAAADAGMFHTGRLYDIALNCLGCHTVPNEELVNRSMHPPGSVDFDLLAWSQGEVRHNFASSGGAPAHPTNRPATQARKRKMYVIGAIVDLDMTLRNIAMAKVKGGTYHMAMVDRAGELRRRLTMIADAAEIAEVRSILAAIPEKFTVDTAIDEGLANTVRAAGRALDQDHDGSDLAKLDPMLPKDVVGAVYDLPR